MHLPGKNNLIESVFFGGTFDPIHNGHLEIISYIKNNFNFSKMFLSPAGNQYMKTMPPIATPEQRFAMCKLAFDDDFITLVDYEIKRSSPSYTIETLRYLKNKYPEFEITHIVLGADAFDEINLWKNGSELLRNYKFIIISRLNSDTEPMSNIKIIESLSDISSSFIREKISENISVLHYTPIEIHKYIKENNLYR